MDFFVKCKRCGEITKSKNSLEETYALWCKRCDNVLVLGYQIIEKRAELFVPVPRHPTFNSLSKTTEIETEKKEGE